MVTYTIQNHLSLWTALLYRNNGWLPIGVTVKYRKKKKNTEKPFWCIYKINKYIQRKNEWAIAFGFCYWKYLLKRLLECVYISFYINRYITFTWAKQRCCKREDEVLGPQKPITVPLQQQGNENQLKAQLILILEGTQHQNTCHTVTF